jgi:hypothetical protein
LWFWFLFLNLLNLYREASLDDSLDQRSFFLKYSLCSVFFGGLTLSHQRRQYSQYVSFFLDIISKSCFIIVVRIIYLIFAFFSPVNVFAGSIGSDYLLLGLVMAMSRVEPGLCQIRGPAHPSKLSVRPI